MTTNKVLIDVGLILVLAVGPQVLAGRLRIPALILLLPVGFAAGALIDDVDPEQLLGAAFSPLVSLAVAVILYDAGLGLNLARLKGHTRRVVVRLLWIGVLITWLLGTLLAAPLLGMSRRAAIMTGAILVVSGPTVVGPLLSFVRPKDRLQHILIWEGSLIDPVGGVLGALVFHAVVASPDHHLGSGTAQFLASVGVGAAGGAVGAALLWPLFRVLRLGEVLGTTAQLAAVIGVAALCDVLRDDTALIAAVVMGLAVANLPGTGAPARRPFFETLVSLILGLLFVSISATVTPHSLRHVSLPALGLAAFLVLVVRPLVAVVSTLGRGTGAGGRPRGAVGTYGVARSLADAEPAAKGLEFARDRFAMNIHGDVNSHLDALCHAIYDGTLHGSAPAADALSPAGASALSVDLVRDGIVRRGVLLDVPRLHGVPWLEPGTSVTAEDLAAAEARQEVRVGRGDIVLVRVGHSRRREELGPWDVSDARAGLHPTGMEFLAEREAAVLGSDGNSDTAPVRWRGSRSPCTYSPSTRCDCICSTTCSSRTSHRSARGRAAGRSCV
ncbi:cation:proton antiporter [Streptomyces sp. NPDC102270]|uniref:cation:proton antiporter domain-containing protein n=1 Tax=Streptomyces sp. NPDC102270 TaxID=3366150 RepID=UPI0037FDA35F